MKRFTVVLALILIAGVIFTSPGQGLTPPPLMILTQEQGEYPLGLSMQLLEDPGGELTIDEVSSPKFDASFIPNAEEIPSRGFTNSAFWLRFRVRNETSASENWLLEAKFPNLNYVDLYLPFSEGGYTVKKSGVLLPYETREIDYHHIVFKIPLAYHEEQTYYIRVKSGSAMLLGFTIWEPIAFTDYAVNNMFMAGLFYGSLLIMFLYYLIALFVYKDKLYFYFALFLLASAVFWSANEGILNSLISFLPPNLIAPIQLVGMALMLVAALKFSDEFLEQKTRSRRTHQFFNILTAALVFILSLLIFMSYSAKAQGLFWLLLISSIVSISAGLYSWRKGYPHAKLYIVSWIGFFVGLIVLLLVRVGIVTSNPFTENLYKFGQVWLVSAWSLAISSRVDQLKKYANEINQKLTKAREDLSNVLESLPLGVVVFGIDKKPTFVNQRGLKILHNPSTNIFPSTADNRTLEESMEYFSLKLSGTEQPYPVDKFPTWQAYSGNSASADDVEADLGDRRVALEVWANPILDDTGGIDSVVTTFQDISLRRKMNAELEEYRLQLEKLVSERTLQLSLANERLRAENAERRRLEEMLRLRLEWLVVVNQVNQDISNTNDLPQAFTHLCNKIKGLFDAVNITLADFDESESALTILASTCHKDPHHDLAGEIFPVPAGVNLRKFRSRLFPVSLTPGDLGEIQGLVGQHFEHSHFEKLVLVPREQHDGATWVIGLELAEAGRQFSADEVTLIEKIFLDIAQIKDKAHLMEQNRALIAADERSRLARDLHDSVTQVLFAASLVAEVLPQIWRNDPVKAQASLDELRRLTRGALAEMRTMLLELRPSAAIKTPLAELLTQLTEAATGRSGLTYELSFEQTPALPEEVHINFYRIAQESLNNIVKHARASHLTIKLGSAVLPSALPEDELFEVKLVVQDDGRGFDTREGPRHLGLAFMQERASAINADLSVESCLGQGTTVTLVWRN